MSKTANPERNAVMLEQFLQALRRHPFQPFRLVMDGGGQPITIDRPEFIAIDRRGREITFHDPDNSRYLIDTHLIAEVIPAPTVDADQVRANWQAEPFKPFALVMSSGDRLLATRRDLLIVAPQGGTAVLVDPNSRVHILDLDHVVYLDEDGGSAV